MLTVFYLQQDLTNPLVPVQPVHCNALTSLFCTVAVMASSVLEKRAEKIIQDLFLDACKTNDLEKVKNCVGLGADINSKDVCGYTGLYLAARENCLDVLDYLLDRTNINVNCKTFNGLTPLMIACIRGHIQVVWRLCLVPSININCKDTSGDTALTNAVYFGNTQCILALKHSIIQPKVNWNVRGKYGDSALIIAVQRAYADILEILLTVPSIDVSAENHEGDGVAQIAVEWIGERRVGERLKCVRMLSKDPRVNWNIKNQEDSEVPIMFALKRDKLDVVKILLNAPGIDLKVKDRSGQTLVQIAR